MSKLAIILCTVLFVSAIEASFVPNPFVSAEDRVKELVTDIIAATKPKFDDIKNNAADLAAKLGEAASSYSEKIFDQVKSTLVQAQVEVDDLTGKFHGVDVADCKKFASHLDHTGLAAIANMSACIVDKLETGSGYAQTIITLSENVLANLTGIIEEARHCGANVDGIIGAAGAIVCTNMAALKATWAETTNVPALTLQMTKITYLLAALQPSLAYCITSNGFVSFYREASTVAERTKQCIHEARTAVEGASTLEKVTEEGLIEA